MKIQQFKSILEKAPEKNIQFVLPDGVRIPPHFHICEVAQVQRNFIDCCGAKQSETVYAFQARAGKPASDEKQSMPAAKLSGIIALASEILSDEQISIEIEFKAPHLSQFPIHSFEAQEREIVFQLDEKETECLEQKEWEAKPNSCCYCHAHGC